MMENVLKDLSIEVIVTTIAIVFTIRELIGLIIAIIKDELLFKQQQRHKLRKIEIDLLIQQKQSETTMKLKKEQLLLDESFKFNFLESAISVQHIMKQLREWSDAVSVSLLLFHNGVAKGFKHYSIRYEETRTFANSIYEHYQIKPLQGYFKIIKQLEKQNIVKVSITDDITDGNQVVNWFLNAHKLNKMFIAPILIPIDSNIPDEQKIMRLEKNGEDFFIIGLITLAMDENSNDLSDEVMMSMMYNKVDDITNLYKRNSRILG